MEEEDMPLGQGCAAAICDDDCGAAGTMGWINKRAARSDDQTEICAEFEQRSKEKSKDIYGRCKGNGRAMGGEM